MPSSQDPSCCCLPRCYFLLLFTSLLLPVVVYLAVTSCCCLPRCYFLLLFTLLSVPLLEPLHNINARTFLVSCKISSLWSEACVMGVPVETLPCILIYTPPFTPLLFFLLPPLLPSPPPPLLLPLLPSSPLPSTTSTTSSRCIVCEQCLPESYYQLEEQPYCRDHYYERTAHKCQKCSDYITGPTMVGGCPFSGYRSGNETLMVMWCLIPKPCCSL